MRADTIYWAPSSEHSSTFPNRVRAFTDTRSRRDLFDMFQQNRPAVPKNTRNGLTTRCLFTLKFQHCFREASPAGRDGLGDAEGWLKAGSSSALPALPLPAPALRERQGKASGTALTSRAEPTTPQRAVLVLQRLFRRRNNNHHSTAVLEQTGTTFLRQSHAPDLQDTTANYLLSG